MFPPPGDDKGWRGQIVGRAMKRLKQHNPPPGGCFATEDALEPLLGGRTRDIRLDGALADAYLERSWRQTAKIVRSWMLWVILIDVVGFIVNLALLPQATALAMLWPAVTVAAVALAVRAVWARRRGNFIHHVSLTAGILCISLSVAFMGILAGGEFYERYLNVMVFIAITGIIIFNIPLAWAGIVAVATMAMYLAFQLANPGLDGSSALSAFLFFAAGVGSTVIARQTMTILAQKSFLLDLRDRQLVGELAEANRRLEVLSRTDPLTGVANRRSMMEAAQELWRAGGDMALLMCDIDHFKAINDLCGHARGDEVLQRVARLIEGGLRGPRDLVARYGGEEFLVLLDGADEEEALATARAIRAAVEAAGMPNPGPNPGARASAVVTISIGVASRCEAFRPATLDELQGAADQALYRAKNGGRNRVAAHVPAPVADLAAG